MAAKIFPTVKARILEIWDYTEKTWGDEQADKYVRGLIDAINRAQNQSRRWKPVMDEALPRVFFLRYRHHYIFFRKLSKGTLGVISILHENMDLPSRLKEDAGQSETE